MIFRELITSCVCFLLTVATAVNGQVTMRTNLLKTVPPGKSMTFEVIIEKGNISGFSKFQIEAPEGVSFKAVENAGGEFEFSENKARIVWVVTPADQSLSIRMKLLPVANPMNADLVFKYYYIVDDTKKEFESFPFVLHVKDTTLPVFMSASMSQLQSRFEPAIPLPAVKPEQVKKQSPAEVDQQVTQMRKDAAEAARVGQAEKERVNNRIDSINSLIDLAENIADSSERVIKLAELGEVKNKSLEDLQVAERVITLAASLEKQSNEIERINKDQTLKAPKPVATKVKLKSESQTQMPTKSAPAEAPVVQKNVTMPKIVNETGLVYKIQLGAFKQSPDLLEMKSAGEIELVVENSVYKVLLGSFSTKEEAQKRRDQLSSKYLGCFIVTYRNGERVK